MSLLKKTITGGLWLGGISWLGFFSNFALRAVLMRILSPSDFGIYALAFSVIGMLFLIFGFSFSLAAISLQGEKDTFDTAMWLSIFAGASIAVLAVITAWICSHFYAKPVAQIVAVLGCIQIFILTARIYSAYEEKNLYYKEISIIKGISRPIGFIVAIIAACFFHVGVWALVMLDVVAAIVLFLGQRKVSHYQFKGRFNKTTAHKIWQFSYKMFFNRMLESLYSKVSLLLIGSFFGITFLGFFQHAYYFITLPNTLITSILVKLNFVVFSKIREDKSKLEKALYLSNFILFRVMVLSSLLLFLFPEFIIRLIYTDRWLPSAPILQKFSLLLLLFPLFNLLKSYNYSQRKFLRMVVAFLQRNIILYALIFALIVWQRQSYLPYTYLISMVIPLIYLCRKLKEDQIRLSYFNIVCYPVLVAAALSILGKVLMSRISPFASLIILTSLYVTLVIFRDKHKYIALVNKLKYAGHDE